jgi:hypothetical protein
MKAATRQRWKELLCRVFDHRYVGLGTSYVWCGRCHRFFGKLGEQVHTKGFIVT